MSNYLRKLGVFHTPPLSVPEDASLTGYVINTNGLKPIRFKETAPLTKVASVAR